MRLSIAFSSFYVLALCWLWGAELGTAKIVHAENAVEAPYRAVMQQAIDGLARNGVAVAMPNQLPSLVFCTPCLQQSEAFGAYEDDQDHVVLPEHFDIATIDGQAVLIHEYGHYLLTKAGVPAEEQEKLCLALGNGVYQKFFTASLN